MSKKWNKKSGGKWAINISFFSNADARIEHFLNNVPAVKLYSGYVEDYRNNKNAWVESEGYRYHGSGENTLQDVEFQPKEGIKKVFWGVVNDEIASKIFRDV